MTIRTTHTDKLKRKQTVYLMISPDTMLYSLSCCQKEIPMTFSGRAVAHTRLYIRYVQIAELVSRGLL